MVISSSAIKKKRIHAKFIFISKIRMNSHTYDIGILDDAYNFFIHQLTIKTKALTFANCKSLNKLFNAYSITYETEIDFLDTISKTEPLYLYLSTINQQIFSNMRFVKLDTIPKRIAAYHTSYLNHKKASEITKYMIERLWNKLVELEKCPWISQQINNELMLKSILFFRRQKILRLGLYYMIVKRFLVTRTIQNRISREKQSAR